MSDTKTKQPEAPRKGGVFIIEDGKTQQTHGPEIERAKSEKEERENAERENAEAEKAEKKETDHLRREAAKAKRKAANNTNENQEG